MKTLNVVTEKGVAFTFNEDINLLSCLHNKIQTYLYDIKGVRYWRKRIKEYKRLKKIQNRILSIMTSLEEIDILGGKL
jgi:hypothetical protein